MEILTVAEAARTLGCAAETVRELDRRGELPAMRTPGGWRVFLKADVERVAAERAARRRR